MLAVILTHINENFNHINTLKMKQLFFSLVLTLGLCFTSCSDKDKDENLPINNEPVKCSLKITGFTQEIDLMSLKTAYTPDDAEIAFYDDYGNYVRSFVYNDNFAGNIEFELPQGDYKYIITVYEDYSPYYFTARDWEHDYDKVMIYISRFAVDKPIWYANGTLSVTADGVSENTIDVSCPLGELNVDITNEAFPESWDHVYLRVVPMGYNFKDLNPWTVALLPGNNTTTVESTGSELQNRVSASFGQFDFKTFLFPHEAKYKLRIEITSIYSNDPYDPIIVENIEIKKGYTTTVRGELQVNPVGNGTGNYSLNIEDVTMIEGEIIEF